MFVQRFVKGIANLGDRDVETIFQSGLLSTGIRTSPKTAYVDAAHELSEAGLYEHVTNYKACEARTLYVSLTAGTRTASRGSGGLFRTLPAWAIALGFATDGHRTDGVVFDGWVIVLGRPSWHVVGVAEDIRDRHEYPTFNRYWTQGEVTAKLVIPSPQLTRATFVDRNGRPLYSRENPQAMDPVGFSNVREVV